MTTDREFKELFDSLQFMLRDAYKNQWPKSPQARDDMHDQLIAALEPVHRVFELTVPREHLKRRRAA